MYKYAEMFYTSKDCKLAMAVFIQICCVIFKCYLDKNQALHTPTFDMKMNHFSIVFHMS